MNSNWYELSEPSSLLSPALLVYPEIIRRNIAESIRMTGSAARLRPHVKTHKTPEIVKMALEQGVTKHKCATLMEAAMLAQCGAPDVLIAYPTVGPAIDKLLQLVDEFPQTIFRCVVDAPETAKQISHASANRGITIDVLLDIDTGMHRTGIEPGPAAVELYSLIANLPGLTAGGFHVYDGQNHQPNFAERQVAVNNLMHPVNQLAAALQALGLSIPRLVCGGTPTFPIFAAMNEALIECSPGTCFLSDYNYGRNYPEMSAIAHAAVLFSRVISRCGTNRLTIDLGYKAVSGDQPAGRRCHILNIPDAKEVGHSEEHLIIETSHANEFPIGAPVYALPAHVCPTVALHSHLQVVKSGVIIDRWSVVARDRFYKL